MSRFIGGRHPKTDLEGVRESQGPRSQSAATSESPSVIVGCHSKDTGRKKSRPTIALRPPFDTCTTCEVKLLTRRRHSPNGSRKIQNGNSRGLFYPAARGVVTPASRGPGKFCFEKKSFKGLTYVCILDGLLILPNAAVSGEGLALNVSG